MLAVIILCLCLTYVENSKIQSLNKCEWKFKNHNISSKEEKCSKFPVGIYSDFQKIKYKDFFKGFNDSTYGTKVTNKITEYYCTFKVEVDIIDEQPVELVFYGVDGIADIYLNSGHVGKVSNTFVTYRFDVKNSIHKYSENTLKIVFVSPIEKATELSNKFKNYSSSHQRRNKFTLKNVHLLRRMQASFGTEWAPAAPSVGVLKDVELIVYNNIPVIRDITTLIRKESSVWKVKITVHYDVAHQYISGNSDKNNIQLVSGTVTAILENSQNFSDKQVFTQESTVATSYTVTLNIDVPENYITEWYPNGYGTQKLYTLKVLFASKGSYSASVSKTIKIAFRTIELNKQEVYASDPKKAENLAVNEDIASSSSDQYNYQIPTNPESFYFIVNNVPIFAKGASFLPVSIFPEESCDETKIKYLLESAKAANMNMLRVPASGIYQCDYFYQKCDELGLLIWQEMMLDKEMLPFSDEEFKKSITEEINQQYRRLQYHPSIALWVANNRIQETISNTRNKETQKQWFEEYSKFIDDIFINIVGKDTSRPYITTTPFNKIKTDRENINMSENLNSHLSGDTHIGTISNEWILEETIPVPRFISEYKSWSLPSFNSFLSQTSTSSDLSSIDTKFMQHRQRSDTGVAFTELISSITEHFGVPIKKQVDAFIYASQIHQAWTMKVQTEHFRAHRSENLGSAMGALFWHLNDVWHVLSTSSIEFNGRWKMLHYYAHHFFAPVASSIEVFGCEQIKIYLISDMLKDIKVDIKFEIFYWSQLNPVDTLIVSSVNVEKLTSLPLDYSVIDMNINIFLEKYCGENFKIISEKCLLKLTILQSDNKQVLNTNYLLPAGSLWDIEDLPNPKLEAEVIDCNKQGHCKIKLRTDHIALFVWLEVTNVTGYFSDNGFIMTESEKEIIFYLKEEEAISVQKIIDSLKHKIISKNFILENFSKPPYQKEKQKHNMFMCFTGI